MKEKEKFSRRGFLKTAAVMGATLTVSPALDKVQAVTHTVSNNKNILTDSARAAAITAHRTLGTGKAAFDVSALV